MSRLRAVAALALTHHDRGLRALPLPGPTQHAILAANACTVLALLQPLGVTPRPNEYAGTVGLILGFLVLLVLPAGGVFVSIGIELAKKVLSLYLTSVPTYSVLYGTFATLPILLLWIYVAWVIVLLGAVVAAYLPSLLAGVSRRPGSPGWNFMLAIEVLQHLHHERNGVRHGLTATEMALMKIFAACPGEPVSREKLVEDLGRDRGQAQERAVDVQITRLRRKIESDPRQPRYLQTVRGEGYMLAPD